MASALARHRARRGWFGRGRTRALLSVGLLLGMGAVATSAYWTDREDASGTSINAGTMHVDLAANHRVRPESHTWAALSPSDLTPGTSKAAVLPVTNNSRGALTFSYRVQAAASGPLGDALVVTVRRGGTSDGATCSGGVLVGAAGAPLDGFDQPAGAQLATTQSHQLCIQVTLPVGSSVGPGASSDLAFTFPATQVDS